MTREDSFRRRSETLNWSIRAWRSDQYYKRSEMELWHGTTRKYNKQKQWQQSVSEGCQLCSETFS